MIYPGDVLVVTEEVSAEVGHENQPEKGTYTVQSGDTLSKIAEQFGTSYQVIAEKNSIEDANLIYPGQVLVI